MTDFFARVRTLVTALPTWLTAVAAICSIVIAELGDYVDNPVAAWLVRVAGVVLTVVTVAATIVRRVTPVIPRDRGLLPIDNPLPAAAVRRDRGLGTVETIVLVVVVFFALVGMFAAFGWAFP